MFYIIMGVCGCGKTLIGKSLANQLNIPFHDGDDFHSPFNKTKMNQGVALTDEDRFPWLLAIHRHIKSFVNSNQSGVVTCSALKKEYRNILINGSSATDTSDSLRDSIIFLYLKGSASLIRDRLMHRTNHFMPVDLLDSQFATLEEPDNEERHMDVNIDNDVENIVQELFNILNK